MFYYPFMTLCYPSPCPSGSEGPQGIPGPIGPPGPAGPPIVGSTAMFFGTTTGTGSLGNDYAATIAAGAPVPFPLNGPAIGPAISRSSASTFIVATTGIYEVSWGVAFVEPSQLQITVNGFAVDSTTTLSGAGTQINTNRVIVSMVAGDTLSIINPVGNATALTVQPADGSLTHAQAPNLIIMLVG